MAAPQGKLVVPLGVNPSGVLRTLELDASDLLKLVIAAALPAGDNNIGNVDIVSSALPTGAATLAEQLTQTTALQLIDDLRNALATVATDKLRASIVDALVAGSARIGSVGIEGYYSGAWQKAPIPFGPSSPLLKRHALTVHAGGNQTVNGDTVPAGELWIYTSMDAVDVTSSPTGIFMEVDDGTVVYIFNNKLVLGANEHFPYTCFVPVPAGSKMKVLFLGTAANDTLVWTGIGYKMDLDL